MITTNPADEKEQTRWDKDVLGEAKSKSMDEYERIEVRLHVCLSVCISHISHIYVYYIYIYHLITHLTVLVTVTVPPN